MIPVLYERDGSICSFAVMDKTLNIGVPDMDVYDCVWWVESPHVMLFDMPSAFLNHMPSRRSIYYHRVRQRVAENQIHRAVFALVDSVGDRTRTNGRNVFTQSQFSALNDAGYGAMRSIRKCAFDSGKASCFAVLEAFGRQKRIP